ncbi:MAG: RNA polymerase sigma factor [Polyangiaceae bacterium]|nr:RNA polymerase sigma factor [Myxococcales bacterium]MCB9589935.1 RNA polymerase sigma factor [Polyangiaceae bacterium]
MPTPPKARQHSSSEGALARSTREPELVERAVAGELDAITELLRDLGPLVARTVRVILGNQHADADDVVQQSFVALIRSLPQYRAESNLATYTSRITTRTALAARRRERRRAEVHESYALAQPEQLVSPREEVASHIHALLDELVEEQAETLALRTVLGFSIDEIAEAMEVPRNTVKSRLRLAKAALRERLWDQQRADSEQPGAADAGGEA